MKKIVIGVVSAVMLSQCTGFAAEPDIAENVDFSDFAVIDDIGGSDEAVQLMEGEAWDGGMTEVIPDGTVYHITTPSQLAWIAEQVNTQKDKVGKYVGMSGMTIELDADIDLAGLEWTPIGKTYASPFAGTFNGNGHTVKGLTFNAAASSEAGLFGCVIGGITDLKVETIDGGIETDRAVKQSGENAKLNGIGILAGCVDERQFAYDSKTYLGSINRCEVSGSLTVNNTISGEEYYVGGIAGVNASSIGLTACSSSAQIKVVSANKNGADRAYAGVVNGYNSGNVSECRADGSVVDITSSNPSMGGICGGNSGEVTDCTATAAFKVTNLDSSFEKFINIGGITGDNDGKIVNCTAQTSMDKDSVTKGTSADDFSVQLNAGGIAGCNNAEVSQCKAYGTFEINADVTINAGGIAGISQPEDGVNNECVIKNSNSGMTIKADNQRAYVNAGGIAGYSKGIIDSCTSGDSSLAETSAIEASADFEANVGGTAGVSYNLIKDCVVNNIVTISGKCTEMTGSTINAGGTAGKNGGMVKASRSAAEVIASGTNSFAGGITGVSAYDTDNSCYGGGSSKAWVYQCISEAGVIGNTAGGISASGSSVSFNECISNGTVYGIQYCGGVLGSGANNVVIQNICVKAQLMMAYARTACGVAASLGKADNTNVISRIYLSPTFSNETEAAMVISDDTLVGSRSLIYYNKEETGIESDDYAVGLTNSEAADVSKYVDSSGRFDFSSCWVMKDGSPVPAFTQYSNSTAEMTVESWRYIGFNVSLANPREGEHVYVALYDKDERCCGTVSDIYGSDNTSFTVNATGTRADAYMQFKYIYWNSDITGAAENIPTSYKVFTWDDENGMKNLSSVFEGEIIYNIESLSSVSNYEKAQILAELKAEK